MPDNVKSVEEIGNIKIDQVCIGSCTNSSLMDMLKVAALLRGRQIDWNKLNPWLDCIHTYGKY